MVSKIHPTKARILETTRSLLERGDDVSMGRIAEAAGVTRQLLYFHFAGRTDLFLALARSIDSTTRTSEMQGTVDDAATAADALEQAVRVQSQIKPKIHAVADAVYRLASHDEAAARAWEERESERFNRVVELVERIDREGALAEGWDSDAAARLIWAATSQLSWSQLVPTGHWTNEQWVERTSRMLKDTLLREISRDSSRI